MEIIDIDNPYEDYWREKERKKEEEQSYPLVSPPEVDLLVPITFRWIILVKIIKGYSRITETNIKCNGYR